MCQSFGSERHKIQRKQSLLQNWVQLSELEVLGVVQAREQEGRVGVTQAQHIGDAHHPSAVSQQTQSPSGKVGARGWTPLPRWYTATSWLCLGEKRPLSQLPRHEFPSVALPPTPMGTPDRGCSATPCAVPITSKLTLGWRHPEELPRNKSPPLPG